MILQLLTGIHNLTTLLFGIFISAFFLGVKPIMKNFGKLLLFALVDVFFYWGINLFTGTAFANQLYPVLVHLPLILFLFLCYRYSLLSCCISVFSAYLCCQFSNWIGILFLSLSGSEVLYYLSRILVTLSVFFFLSRNLCQTTALLFSKSNRELCILGAMPLVYYLFDYATTKFSTLLYSGSKVIVEFLAFSMCLSYVVFLLVYFREYEMKHRAEQYGELMDMQLDSLRTEIDQTRVSEHRLAILRHDMRHHLAAIETFIRQQKTDRALEYIQEINRHYDDTVIRSFCKNELLNSVLSIYSTRFSEKGISFDSQIQVSESLPCPELTCCAILSNILENAMHAVEKLPEERRQISLNIFEKSGHLLMLGKNPTDVPPVFSDDVPVTKKSDHGIGVQSIIYYVEKEQGQYQFYMEGRDFVVRIIL